MKPQLSDPDNSYKKNLTSQCCRNYRPFLLLLAGIVLFSGCENDIEKINSITSQQKLPEVTGKNFEIIYSDSARIKVRVLAPQIIKISDPQEPRTEFPRGLTAYFYDDSLNIESIIEADYVIYYEADRLWEAKNDCEARNLKTGEQLNTEHLFWNEKKKIIYSNTYSRIITKDGTFYGERGFEAKQDLTKWKMKGSKGVVNVKNE